MSYAKLFSSITESSLWSEPKEVRLLFVSMLAKADINGFVETSVPGLSRMANLTIAEVEAAIIVLESPDSHSMNRNCDGRRLLRVDRGWVLINYEEYRDRKDESARKEYLRNYMAEYRAAGRDKTRTIPAPSGKQLVNSCKHSSTKDIAASASALNSQGDCKGGKPPVSEAGQIYALYPKKVGRPVALRAIEKALKAHGFEHLVKATENFSRAWQGASPDEMKFCPHPQTWFNQERYNDDPSTWKRNGTNGAARVLNPAAERRNAGTIGGTDYGAAGRRKLERQEAERLAKEQAANEAESSAVGGDGQPAV